MTGKGYRKYPTIYIPSAYLDKLLGRGFDHAEGWLEEGLILCDYCKNDYLKDKSRALGVSGGWLTDEHCPLHKKLWLRLWFIV